MAAIKRSKIKKNDQVVVIAGRDKGRRGRVLEVAPASGKVKVEGVGMIKRHQRANPQANRGGCAGHDGSPVGIRLHAPMASARRARIRPIREGARLVPLTASVTWNRSRARPCSVLTMAWLMLTPQEVNT